MRRFSFTVLVLLQMLVLTSIAAAQSLADIAQQEEARRKTVKAPSKVYTNQNLRPEDLTTMPPPPATSPAPAPAVAADDADQPGATDAAPARDEKYWRGRIEAARSALTRAEMFQEALQSRINALSADFVNRDDPAQRNVIATERQKALAELDRVKQEIASGQKAIAEIQEEARRANVPAGWMR